MQRLEVSGAVRPLYGSLGVKALMKTRQDSQDLQDRREDLLKYIWSTTRRYSVACSTVILYKISSVEMLGCFVFWLITGGKLD
jgi:hypothetical protein